MLANSASDTEEQWRVYAQARLSRDSRFDGRFFVAVKSTGIFCRPICPAKLPLEKNVEYFEHATQALHHGYRPCLRCRPDSAPSSFAWQGVTTTVKRGISLLSHIPSQPVSHVAERLGISERYLNKLLQSGLGLSAKQYQSLHRVLFAKQLLQQTEMTVDDVALSAGYGSSRQLQRAVQQYCKTTPSALRKSVKGNAPTVTLRLAYLPPYNWPQVRDFLKMRAIEGVEAVSDNSYQRYIRVKGEVGRIKAIHNAHANGFDIELRLPSLDGLHSIIEKIKGVLDLHADPQLIKASLHGAGLPLALIDEGIRLPGTWDVFESGCRAIVGQQVSVKAAIGQASLLAKQLHSPIGTVTCPGFAFPSPQQVASSDVSFLRMPNARKQALISFASLFAQQPSATTPDDDAIMAIKGVGQWTLDYIKMRGEKDPDVYLAGDLIVKKMAAKYPVSAEKAAPWRSYLTLQLWELSKR